MPRQLISSTESTPRHTPPPRQRKLLMANRGEIASRVFRAATELGFRTVAIYAPEDRLAIHRFKAGEASLVGACKGPVGAYLDSPGIITLAQEKGVQQIPAQVGETVESKDLPMKLRQA